MNLQERLQKLAQERHNLQIAIFEITGAMKILEEQILENQATPEGSQQSDKEASTPQEEAVPQQ